MTAIQEVDDKKDEGNNEDEDRHDVKDDEGRSCSLSPSPTD